MNPAHVQADVQLFSGCRDDQYSSDGDMMNNKVGGALTNAFIRTYETIPNQTYPDFIRQMRDSMKSDGYDQIPQLSSSQAFGLGDKYFSLTEGIEANTNEQVLTSAHSCMCSRTRTFALPI